MESLAFTLYSFLASRISSQDSSHAVQGSTTSTSLPQKDTLMTSSSSFHPQHSNHTYQQSKKPFSSHQRYKKRPPSHRRTSYFGQTVNRNTQLPYQQRHRQWSCEDCFSKGAHRDTDRIDEEKEEQEQEEEQGYDDDSSRSSSGLVIALVPDHDEYPDHPDDVLDNERHDRLEDLLLYGMPKNSFIGNSDFIDSLDVQDSFQRDGSYHPSYSNNDSSDNTSSDTNTNASTNTNVNFASCSCSSSSSSKAQIPNSSSYVDDLAQYSSPPVHKPHLNGSSTSYDSDLSNPPPHLDDNYVDVSPYVKTLFPKLTYLDQYNLDIVMQALIVATRAHAGQKRKSGEPFIIHPVAVAEILAGLKMDTETIVAGLLHDTVEDTDLTFEELEKQFGIHVRKIVEGETKFSKLASKVHRNTTTIDSPPQSQVNVGSAQSLAQVNGVAVHLSQVISDPDTTQVINDDATLLEQENQQGKQQQKPLQFQQQEQQQQQEGVQKKKKTKEQESDSQADNLRSMFLAMTEDVRVIIVKLADRLHNMRTLQHMSPQKQQKIAKETLDFFAPLAHRLGMGYFKRELEEISFKFLLPIQYESLKADLQSVLNRSRAEHYLEEAKAQLERMVLEDPFLSPIIKSVTVTHRPKELYSLYKKTQSNQSLDSVISLSCINVIAKITHQDDHDLGEDSKKQGKRKENSPGKNVCYHLLGRIHSMWKPLPGRMKDFIAFPNSNGYQALHTTILLKNGTGFFHVDVQIQSEEMHRIAEQGIAAQIGSTYDSGKIATSQDDWRHRTMLWLRSIRDYCNEFSDSSRDLVDAVRRDLLGNRVFIFTPTGNIIDLPKGSTPIDVAYRIHSDVGNKMLGAFVNGRMMSLDWELENADLVKIMTSPSARGPTREWLKGAKTRTARQKIRKAIREQERRQRVDSGKTILSMAAMWRKRPEIERYQVQEKVSELSALFTNMLGVPIRNADEFYTKISGLESLDKELEDAIFLILDAKGLEKSQENGALIMKKNNVESKDGDDFEDDDDEEDNEKGDTSNKLDKKNFVIKLAPCCQPIRGDQIMGVMTSQSDVNIHRLQCEELLRNLRERPCDCMGAAWRDDEPTWLNGNLSSSSTSPSRSHSHRRVEISEKSSAMNKWRTNGTGTGNQRGVAGAPRYVARIEVKAVDRDGLLSYVSGVISSNGKSIRRCLLLTSGEVVQLNFEIWIEGRKELQNLMKRVERVDGIVEVRRTPLTELECSFGMPLDKEGYLVETSEIEIIELDSNDAMMEENSNKGEQKQE